MVYFPFSFFVYKMWYQLRFIVFGCVIVFLTKKKKACRTLLLKLYCGGLRKRWKWLLGPAKRCPHSLLGLSLFLALGSRQTNNRLSQRQIDDGPHQICCSYCLLLWVKMRLSYGLSVLERNSKQLRESGFRCQVSQRINYTGLSLLQHQAAKGWKPSLYRAGRRLSLEKPPEQEDSVQTLLAHKDKLSSDHCMRYVLPPPRPSLFSRGHKALHETSVPAAPLLGSMGHLNPQSWFRKGRWIQPKGPQLSRLGNALRAECFMTV